MSRPRSDGRTGGGIALLFEPSMKFSYYCLNFPKPTSFEILPAKCNCNTPFILICIYRSSSDSFATFKDEFESLLSCLLLLPLPSVLGGDFNVHINSPHDSDTLFLTSLLAEYDYKIFSPTRPTCTSGNILDFIIVPNTLLNLFRSVVVDDSPSPSDHYPVLFQIDLFTADEVVSSQPRRCRAYRSMNHDSFTTDLQNYLSNINGSSFKSYLDNFNMSLTSLLDEHAPFRTLQERERDNPPWMDQDYIRHRSLRKRLQNSPNKAAYNAQKRHCAYLAKQKRREYYSTFCDNIPSHDQKQLYRALNKLCGRSKTGSDLPPHSDPVQLANSFNQFFVKKTLDIRSAIEANNDTDSVHSNYHLIPTEDKPYELNNFQPTNGEEIRTIIKKHGIKTGPYDPLPAFLIERHLEELLPHFVNLVNLSILEETCEGLTEAHVVPLLKYFDLDKEIYKNFRPVSLLSFISKLTERIVHSRINTYLNDNNLQTTSQYGYKKHHSCETMLLKLIDDILVAVDRKLGVVLLIVDLSAAFDSVDHRLLFNILEFKYRITGSALAWIKSFLCDRTQRVKIGNCLSDSLVITIGVAQGSILGPLLFNLYCSGMDSAFQKSGFKSMGYADDNSGIRVFPAFSALSTVYSKIPDCLSSIRQWCSSHFLKLNSDKTSLIAFGDQEFHSNFNFTCSHSDLGDILPISKTVKLLGVHLDSQLSFNDHIASTVTSVNNMLRNLRSIRKYLSRRASENLIHCIITNKLDNCNSLYLGVNRYNIDKLQRMQNNALRFVLNLSPYDNISDHLREAHWLTVDKRVYFKYLVLIWKCLNNKAPIGLSEKLQMDSAFNMLLNTSCFQPLSSFGRRSFSYLAPRLWNALSLDLRTCPVLNIFKRKLKHFLFDSFIDYMHNINPYTSVVHSQTIASNYSISTRRFYSQ